MFTCKSSRLDMNFEVHVESESIGSNAKQVCFVMTIHDLGCDYTQFNEFINCDQMASLRSRIVWLRINLPGQQNDAPDLKLNKYPSLEELGEELDSVLTELNVPQVVCMGQGAGANIAIHFSVKHPSRCLGLILIEPVGSPASLFQSFKFKLLNRRRTISSSDGVTYSSPTFSPNSKIFQRRRTSSFCERAHSISIQPRIDEDSVVECDRFNFDMDDKTSRHQILMSDSFNTKNVGLFAESVMNRSSLAEKLNEIGADTMIVVGRNGKSYGEAKKLYRVLQDLNKKNPEKLVNSPFIDIENVSSVLEECPSRLTTSLQYFLQGIGLLSAMPMRNSICEAMCKKLLSNQMKALSVDDESHSRRFSESQISGLSLRQ